MRSLLLLRHAKSSWDYPDLDDFDRPLAPRGRKAARRMADYLKQKGMQPDLVLCSAALRAVQTWVLVSEILGEAVEVKYLRGLYLAPPSRMLSSIRQAGDAQTCVMLIAHNPGMEHLASVLAGPNSDQKALQKLHQKYPTAALAEIAFEAPSWQEIQRGSGRLKRLVRPKDLA